MLKQICLGLLLAAALSEARAAWTLTEGTNNGGPGSAVEVKLDDKLSARFVHGAGQFKPYLHVFGEDGKLLTNAGLDASGKADGLFPHHRGIYIGWNKITSDLGAFDLWHFNNGGKMNVAKFEKLEGGRDAATLVATIEWRGGKKERRRQRPAAHRDAHPSHLAARGQTHASGRQVRAEGRARPDSGR